MQEKDDIDSMDVINTAVSYLQNRKKAPDSEQPPRVPRVTS